MDYTTFDCNVQCEEFNGVSEEEYAEVMALMAEESEAAEGYGEWSEQVEQATEPVKDWQGGYTNRREGPKHQGWDI